MRRPDTRAVAIPLMQSEQLMIGLRGFHSGVAYAIAAAALFGASTPFAKMLLGRVDPIMLAGLLYLSSGLGLTVWRWGRSRRQASSTRP